MAPAEPALLWALGIPRGCEATRYPKHSCPMGISTRGYLFQQDCSEVAEVRRSAGNLPSKKRSGSKADFYPPLKRLELWRYRNTGDTGTLEILEHWRYWNTGDTETLEIQEHWRYWNTEDAGHRRCWTLKMLDTEDAGHWRSRRQ